MRYLIGFAASCLLALPGVGNAEMAYSCHGTAPDWTLKIEPPIAQFRFPATTEMEIALDTPAEGKDWPRALTLIGDRDTAIVVIEQEICSKTAPYRAHVMTQRGQTPILLTGCCVVPE